MFWIIFILIWVCSFGMERIEYRVLVKADMHFIFKEEDIFPTQEELLNSL